MYNMRLCNDSALHKFSHRAKTTFVSGRNCGTPGPAAATSFILPQTLWICLFNEFRISLCRTRAKK